jgi:hypothetical protein
MPRPGKLCHGWHHLRDLENDPDYAALFDSA